MSQSLSTPVSEEPTLPHPRPAHLGVYGMAAMLVALAFVLLGSCLLIACWHRNDCYQINHVSGIWIALAEDYRAGHLYPDLHSGDVFGGTRYMPLGFILHAHLISLLGDPLLAGKLLALGVGLLIFTAILVMLRRLECPTVGALALAALVLASGSGFLATTSIHGDSLSVLLQLGALLAAGKQASWRRAVLAGVLCALAVLAKMTAVWAAGAILLHYLRQDRRHCLVFTVVWLGSLSGALAWLNHLSQGHMMENFLALSAAGMNGITSFAKAPFRTLYFMAKSGSGVHILAPLMALGCWLAWKQRCWTIYHTALVLCVPIQIVIFSDAGTVSNHLLDLVVLAVLVVGAMWQTAQQARSQIALLEPVLAAVLGWTMCSCWATVLGHETRDTLAEVRSGHHSHRYPAKPLAGYVGDQEKLLSDDPWVVVSRGQRPVILDACSLARTVKTQPRSAENLIRRIHNQEFDKIVLMDPARLGVDRADRKNIEERHLGTAVARAIRSRYRPDRVVEGYIIYVPQVDDESCVAVKHSNR